jgi:hypothetical protein
MQSRGAFLPLFQRPLGLVLLASVVWLLWTGIVRAKTYYRKLDQERLTS